MRIGNLLGVTDLVGLPESVSLAREYVRRKLGDGHPALDDVTLLVSEVVTNSVLHSNSRNGGKVTLALADCYDLVHVDVVDAGGDTVPHVRGDLFTEGGRGLMLVEMLSYRWDVHEDAAGRTVWFQVKYQQDGNDDGLRCPDYRSRPEPAEEQRRTIRETAARAVRTVTESLRQEQALHLMTRWQLDREGLDSAAEVLSVKPLTNEDIHP